MNAHRSRTKGGVVLAAALIVALVAASLPTAAAAPATLPSVGMPGDVDGNGAVDLGDARLVTRFVAGEVSSMPHLENADATQDGAITVEDALAIAQHAEGTSRFVVVKPENGLPGQGYTGSLMRVEVTERFFPFRITGGTVRIRSASTGYDSGDQLLAFERDGRTLYYHWSTVGLAPATDYEASVALSEGSAAAAAGVEGVAAFGFSLEARSFEVPFLADVVDASAPGAGFALEFGRVVPNDSAHAPYLGPLGRGWMLSYDAHLQEHTDGRVAFLSPNGFARWFTSNADGTYTSSPGDYGVLTRDSDGTFQLREKDGFVFRFRPDLRLSTMGDANGNAVTAIYNGSAQLTEIQHSSGHSFRIEYNAQGRIAKLIDHVGRETTYQYDAQGVHLLSVTAPGNRITHYTYSIGNGEAREHRLTSVAYPDGTHRYFEYDNQGRLAIMAGDEGAGRTQIAYDAEGTTRIVDALGHATTVRVNDQKQPVEIVDPLGRTTRYAYDSQYRLVRVTDPLNRAYEYGYDGLGNVSSVIDPADNAYTLTFEPTFSRLTSFVDSRGNATHFTVDGQGNHTRIEHADGTAEAMVYGEHGLIQSKTNRAGETIGYLSYDRGLLETKALPDGDAFTYEYDAAGNLISATNASGTIGLAYDDLDYVTTVTYPGGRAFRYEYDDGGKRTQVTDPDGNVVRYEYDAAGRLARLADAAGQTIASYEYDAANRRTLRTLGNSAYTTYEYDAAGQLIHLVNHRPGGSVVSSFDYTYDDAGNRLSKVTSEGAETYSYDELDQLTGVTYPDGASATYAYDAMGNRISVTEGGSTKAYVTNDLNQYTSAGSVTFTYDANGNLRTRAEGGQTTTYDYDAENRLLAVHSPDETVSYAYNAFGQRSGRTDDQGSLYYLWDDDQVAIEESAAHATQASYTWGGLLDEAVRMQRGSSTYYYVQDALLSVTDLLNSAGNVVEHFGSYSAFGVPAGASAVGNPWRFTGLAYDFDTGLQYNRARHYSPSLGRFTTADPIGIAGGPNLYMYGFNSPSLLSDPYGLKSWGGFWQAVGMGGLKGGFQGFAVGVASLPGVGFMGGPAAIVAAVGGATIVGALTGAAWAGFWYAAGGGACPTFIQLPPDAEPIGEASDALDVSKEKLAGQITVPIDDVLMRSDIPIFGVAGGTDFRSYRVEYGEGANPTQWELIESSTKPQPTTTVGMAEIALMQGDIDIRGNLATWNTGLKNWVHLPWHPPDDPTDLNGIYTVRLVVKGKDGKTVEDRVTGEVGRAINQALPGIAVSPDGRVVMRFPEQSLTAPFRVYTILPITMTEATAPEMPAGVTPIGSIYRIREPGDRFAKDVGLAFSIEQEEALPDGAARVGILGHDAAKKAWRWLATARSADGRTFSTVLSELPAVPALFALGRDVGDEERSQPQAAAPEAKLLPPVRTGVLVEDTFEEDLGAWQARDRFVGATLARDDEATPDGTYALKLTNESQGGSFSVTVLDQPFDARRYPTMSLDYRIGPGVKTDFYLRVNGRWYNLGFTDDAQDFRNRDVNIANLGAIEGIQADDAWHAASVDIYDLLRAKTAHTQVDAIMMADWDATGYMKLDFGQNPRGATYYVDNFRLAAGAAVREAPTAIPVDDFQSDSAANLLGGPSNTFSNPGTSYCRTTVENDEASGSRVLALTYDTSLPEAYCGYWTVLMGADTSEMHELTLRLRAAGEAPPMLVGLRDASSDVEAKLPIAPYLGAADADGWRTAAIPLSAFTGRGLPALTPLDAVSFTFEQDLGSGEGTVWLDDLAFGREPTTGAVADFDATPMETNLLGGGFRTRSTNAAAISAGYHVDKAFSSPVGAVRISYGGNIGLDYGEGRFSYAIWETDLMGFDARAYEDLVIVMRGQDGKEAPNFYLDDGVARRPIRAGELPSLTTSWQEMRLPLKSFGDQGVDLSHLVALQIDFEWEPMSGSVYIAEIRFDEGKP